MEETYLLNHPGVRKKILAGGTGALPHFPPGTKLTFHFQTLKDDFERTVIDDSRLAGRPAEIFVGKMFKMEVWEVLLTSMRVGEVAEFWCDAVHTGLYSIVSKGMRMIAEGKDPLEGQRHMCGMGNLFHYHSTGHADLDELMREPQALIFIMELVQVGDPFSYKRESWMMEKDEKLKEVPSLHMQGNALVRQGSYAQAAEKYQEAVVLLRTVLSREMPGDEDYVAIDRLITPLVLNYCQCMLELGEYYEVILHTSDLLENHRDNVKAYYKRARAYVAVWDAQAARRDYNMVVSLDATLAPLVHRELKNLSDRMREKDWEEKDQYWNILKKEKKEEEEEESKAKGEKTHGGESESAAESSVSGQRNDNGRERSAHAGTEEKKDQPSVKEETTAAGSQGDPAVTEGKDQGAPAVTEGKDQGAPPLTEGKDQGAPALTEGKDQGAPPLTEGKDWQQMLRLTAFLQDEGNFLIKGRSYEEAAGKYREALAYVDFLQNKEVVYGGEDWLSLEKVRLPISLNLSQCLLELREHQQVVEITSKLLLTHTDNLKAVYQRARAHSALCNEGEARRDFAAVERLDPSFRPLVRQEMKRLGELLRSRHVSQKKTYLETTEERWGTAGGRKTGESVMVKEREGGEEEGGTVTCAGKTAAALKEGGRDGVREESSASEKKTEGAEVQREAYNGAGHGETDQPAAVEETAAGGMERSGTDKGAEEVNCQSIAAQQSSLESTGNKGTNNNAGSRGSQSESSNRRPLSSAHLPGTGESEEKARLETQREGESTEEAEESKTEGGREGKSGDERPHLPGVATQTKPRERAGDIDHAGKKSKRKQKKKK